MQQNRILSIFDLIRLCLELLQLGFSSKMSLDAIVVFRNVSQTFTILGIYQICVIWVLCTLKNAEYKQNRLIMVEKGLLPEIDIKVNSPGDVYPDILFRSTSLRRQMSHFHSFQMKTIKHMKKNSKTFRMSRKRKTPDHDVDQNEQIEILDGPSGIHFPGMF